jgi:signal transduction histidine kinase
MNDVRTPGRGSASTFARTTTTSAHPDTRGVHAKPVRRPTAWSLRNWPVKWKVVAIVLVPLALAAGFGGLRISGALAEAGDLRLAADRADVVPAITKYMSALDFALLATSTGGDAEGATKNYQARKDELQSRVASTDVASDVRSGVNSMLGAGQALLGKVASNSIGLRDRVASYAPILLTAENAVDGSVRVDNAAIRAAAQGLSRAIGARGQMMMQQLLITLGAELPEPELRSTMLALAGTEPSTLFGMAEVVGVGSPDAKKLQQQMVARLTTMSDPASVLVNNPQLLSSTQTTDAIAAGVIKDATASVPKSVEDLASNRRGAAIRDATAVPAAIAAALVVVLLVARSLIGPLRALRDGALKAAHEDFERELARVRAGDERAPDPLPIYSTEEIGQVAHAVDELHAQALLLAGDEARLRLLVNDMFVTMSRRNRSLVDQQLSLVDRLERNEGDPDRLDSLFRLDHLAARMRRNGANLLVLAGAEVSRGDQRGPLPLSEVIGAAASEVEEYRRVESRVMLDGTVTATAAGDIVHLLAELIDNALRFSPPTATVRVFAARRSDAGIHLQVIDTGLGMTAGDRRIANMRLRAGGEVTADVSPDTARHMGLFVVGRLAERHGIRVQLRGPSSTGESSSGTAAEVYLPPRVLVDASDTDDPGRAAPQAPIASPPPATVEESVPAADSGESAKHEGVLDTAGRNGWHSTESPVTLLPRRNPGSSGITGVPARPDAAAPQPGRSPRRGLPVPWWETERETERGKTVEPAVESPAAQTRSNTSSFFASRARVRLSPSGDDARRAAARGGAGGRSGVRPAPPSEARGTDDARPAEAAATSGTVDKASDPIYQRMLSDWLVDPRDLARSADLDWKSVWDRGWSAAARVDNVPVAAHTDQGLPVRDPGARLVPGAATPEYTATPEYNGAADHPADHDSGAVSDRGLHSGAAAERNPAHEVSPRDPDAIRASITSHFGGVRAGRSHAHEPHQGSDQQ